MTHIESKSVSNSAKKAISNKKKDPSKKENKHKAKTNSVLSNKRYSLNYDNDLNTASNITKYSTNHSSYTLSYR